MKRLIMMGLVGGLVQMAAAIGTSIAYQGILRNESGQVLSARSQTVEFRLYSEATGDLKNALWGRQYAVMLDETGLFNVELTDSAGTKLSDAPSTTLAEAIRTLQGRDAVYVGIKVKDSAAEIAPRQKLLTVPFAIYAADVAQAAGNFTVGGLATFASGKVTGTIEANKVDAEALTVSKDIVLGNGAMKLTGGETTATFNGNGIVPLGGIIMWSGAADAVPAGWALCDGKTVNGRTTPNLLGRFVLGSGGAYKTGTTGGSETVTLTINEMPSHRHRYLGDDSLAGHDANAEDETGNVYNFDQRSDGGKNGRRYKGEAVGGGQAHNNMPPYYALAFIMRVK